MESKTLEQKKGRRKALELAYAQKLELVRDYNLELGGRKKYNIAQILVNFSKKYSHEDNEVKLTKYNLYKTLREMKGKGFEFKERGRGEVRNLRRKELTNMVSEIIRKPQNMILPGVQVDLQKTETRSSQEFREAGLERENTDYKRDLAEKVNGEEDFYKRGMEKEEIKYGEVNYAHIFLGIGEFSDRRNPKIITKPTLKQKVFRPRKFMPYDGSFWGDVKRGVLEEMHFVPYGLPDVIKEGGVKFFKGAEEKIKLGYNSVVGRINNLSDENRGALYGSLRATTAAITGSVAWLLGLLDYKK
jgi:hypothetical protein